MTNPTATATAAVAPATTAPGRTPLLSMEDFRLEFDTFDGVYRAIDGVSFDLAAGESLGIVGETGCGKSVTAKSILGLVPAPPARVVSGRIRYAGEDLLAAGEAAAAGVAWGGDRDDLPGPHDLSQSGVHDRAAARGRHSRASASATPERAARPARGPRSRDRDAAPRPPAKPGAADARLSAPALRGHAPARADRAGALRQSAPADRGRADHRART